MTASVMFQEADTRMESGTGQCRGYRLHEIVFSGDRTKPPQMRRGAMRDGFEDLLVTAVEERGFGRFAIQHAEQGAVAADRDRQLGQTGLVVADVARVCARVVHALFLQQQRAFAHDAAANGKAEARFEQAFGAPLRSPRSGLGEDVALGRQINDAVAEIEFAARVFAQDPRGVVRVGSVLQLLVEPRQQGVAALEEAGDGIHCVVSGRVRPKGKPDPCQRRQRTRRLPKTS
jgi:hypothetical protein